VFGRLLPSNSEIASLSSFVKRFLVLKDERLAISELEGRSLPNTMVKPSVINAGALNSGLKSLVRSSKDQTELKAIEEALASTNWNRKMAAARLNISYKALLNKVKQYRLTPPQPK